ncbi:hypothetical protein CDAR_223991 [Caerostris darwini]|uniref:Uncharacterized protein n=1 Tax=Caerostris darwini TaxID=1538125 RepID=A0AAV4WLV1_9ARAC|nr:hypothetical protein CDAR_223991 [Caerostris darwini]
MYLKNAGESLPTVSIALLEEKEMTKFRNLAVGVGDGILSLESQKLFWSALSEKNSILRKDRVTFRARSQGEIHSLGSRSTGDPFHYSTASLLVSNLKVHVLADPWVILSIIQQCAH